MARTTSARYVQEEDPFGYGGGGPGVAKKESTSAPKAIGVPKGYGAPVQGPRVKPNVYAHGYSYGAGQYPQQPLIRPQYFDGDQYKLRGMAPSEIFELQQLMAGAGLLTGSFTGRVWDEKSADAYAKVLAYANQHGLSEGQALLELTGGGGRDGGAPGRYTVDENGNLVPVGSEAARAPLVARTTDPRTLELMFREISMNMTGQSLNSAQVKSLASAYNQMEVQRQQAAYDKQLTGGTVVDIPAGEPWLQAEMEERYPGQVEDYSALKLLDESIGKLTAPAMGLV